MKQFEIKHIELKTANACSALYGACLRAARALGRRWIVEQRRAAEKGIGA
ncbi:hypothetical protein [Eubacterium sp.]|nr:hypothetical protein [Eubacterium sp.]MDO5434722.1 hypothetical protein [Eubacterium sp.]